MAGNKEPNKHGRQPCLKHTHRDAHGIVAALEKGADALVTKPIDFAVLRSEIDMRVRRAA
jgi:DNA-binding response OmpR family regulator